MLNNITTGELAKSFGLELVGSADIPLLQTASLEDGGEGALSFVRDNNYARRLSKSEASAIIVPRGMELPERGVSKVYLLSENPYISFAKILEHFYLKKEEPKGISPQACVSKSVKIGKNVTIEAFVFIADDVEIGDDCILHSGVRVGAGCKLGNGVELHANVVLEASARLGNKVLLHPGVVIGSEGFGYTQTPEGNVKFPQVGGVIIEDNVEIGAGTTIDRAAMGNTIIGEGTKIDNLVQIGHGVKLGKHNVICSQSGLAGSAQTGDHVIIASRAGVGDHIKLGNHVTVGPMAGVSKDVADNSIVSGFPAVPHAEWLKMMGMMAQLPSLREQFKMLFKKD